MKVSAAGGVREPVTTLKGKETSHSWPQHLPGGSLVLFTSYESTDYDRGRIEVVNLKTGSRKVLYSGGTFGRYAASGHLLYTQRNTLYAAPVRRSTAGDHGKGGAGARACDGEW